MTTPKNLIFDAGGVLVYPTMPSWFVPVLLPEFLGNRKREITTPEFDAAVSLAFDHIREDIIIVETQVEMQKRRAFLAQINEIMHFNLNENQLNELARDYTYNENRYGWHNDCEKYLDKWKREYRIGMLSDAMPSFLLFAQKRGIINRFEEIVLSTQIGATKPDPKMYAEICTRMHVTPDTCLFIDDRIDNLEGALKFGMSAVQMLRTDDIPIWNGAVVHNFAELNAYLEAQK